MFQNPYKFGTEESKKALNEEIRRQLKNAVVTKVIENNKDYSSSARLIYDENGLILREQFPLYQLEYRYFANGRLESISKCEYGDNKVLSACTYKYNKDGTIQSIYDDIGTAGRGKYIENTYDGKGRCVQKVLKNTRLNLIDILKLSYNDDGRIIRVFGEKENTVKEWDDESLTMTARTVNYDSNGSAMHTGRTVITSYNTAGAIIRQDSETFTKENTYADDGILIQKEFTSKLNKKGNGWINTTVVYDYQ